MITLNLLPLQEKEEIAGRLALNKIFTWGFLSLIFILIFLLLLASVWWYLRIEIGYRSDILKQVDANSQSVAFREFKKEVDQVNRKLKLVNQLQTETNNYPFYLEKLALLAREGISFKHLAVDKDKVILDGYAVNREVLISFRDDLAASPYFEKPDAPLSNFLKQADIDFSFTFKIKR